MAARRMVNTRLREMLRKGLPSFINLSKGERDLIIFITSAKLNQFRFYAVLC